MNYNIQFEHVIPYRAVPLRTGLFPALFVGLIGPGGQDDSLVILDTGAEYSIFNGSRASALGLNLLAGQRVTVSSLGGSVEGYIHPIVLEIEGSQFQTEVVFSLNRIPRELLGRSSVFRQVTWGLRESRQEMYFSPRP